MHDFKQLRVWRKAFDLSVDLYRVTNVFPKEEMYGLKAQIRRSASSVAANIAEGCGRGSNNDFVRFLHMAQGSAFEVQHHLLLAHSLNYICLDQVTDLEERVVNIKRMLSGLITKMSDK